MQRRLEKLGRRRLRVGYGEQTVCETKRNADAFETPTLLDDAVRQRGMTVPGHEDICKPERQLVIYPPWDFQPVQLAERRDYHRTLMTRRQAPKTSSKTTRYTLGDWESDKISSQKIS